MLDVSAESRIAGQAAAAMQRSRGMAGVAEVAAQSTVSTRHLERVFLEQVGLSPKVFGRLLRLDHALELAGPESAGPESAGPGLADARRLSRK